MANSIVEIANGGVDAFKESLSNQDKNFLYVKWCYENAGIKLPVNLTNELLSNQDLFKRVYRGKIKAGDIVTYKATESLSKAAICVSVDNDLDKIVCVEYNEEKTSCLFTSKKAYLDCQIYRLDDSVEEVKPKTKKK